MQNNAIKLLLLWPCKVGVVSVYSQCLDKDTYRQGRRTWQNLNEFPWMNFLSFEEIIKYFLVKVKGFIEICPNIPQYVHFKGCVSEIM